MAKGYAGKKAAFYYRAQGVIQMFDLFNVVKIKHNGIVGTIVDKTVIKGKTMYIVENNKRGTVKGAYGGEWAEFDCTDEDLELVNAAVPSMQKYSMPNIAPQAVYA